jgi:multidrug resistance protein
MHTMLGWLAITVIINVLAFSILFPLAPYYVSRALGPGVDLKDPKIGEIASWLTAVYALMQFFFAPAWGKLSDRIGRKPILIASLAGDAVFYTLFGLSHALTWLFAARILSGIFSSASLAVSQAYAADVTPPEHRAMGMGMIGASFGVGFVLGPAIGGALGRVDLALPLFGSAALALINLAFIVKLLPEPERHVSEQGEGGRGAGFAARIGAMARAVSGPMGFLYLLTFLVTFAFANLEGTFSPYLMQRFGFLSEKSVAAQGGIFAYMGFVMILVQGGAIRPLVKRYGEANLVVAGVGLMALGFAFFSLAPTLFILMVGPIIPITIGNGLNTPSLRALVSKKSAATVQGASLGLSASFDSLARATGPACGGWLYQHYGLGAPYWFGGGIMGLAFLFALAKKRDMSADPAPMPAPAAEPEGA